ncbi:hypothetical protein [Burkholderia vietnamiensis]|uniref:hypothetical protein n=1 Tax=Burkholderia vietnamiensis TaxID=60552 RepID=UPI00075547B0|nr:hypothetical protein [Burkholderia vietnamiensis]HDR9314157.1 hypothetical protein [Burkholderia vietnamiensis]
MKAIEDDVIVTTPPCQTFSAPRHLRRFSVPNLGGWSIEQADVTEVTGQARADYERELRISAIGKLLESPAATPLWRRVCKHAMYSEIRGRSADQRLVMELAIQESMR